jgi:nitrogenase molybdenum-iron protein alpha chain
MPSSYSGIRESRPCTYNDLGACSGELAENFNKKCLKMADRSFSQGLQCQQINSISALISLEDSVFIVHAPQGCAGCVSMAADGYRVGQMHRGVELVKIPRIIVTNIDQNDSIHGGEKKLRETVALAKKRYKPRLIFVFTSCASGIIGDDVDAITQDLQKEAYETASQTGPEARPQAILVPVHCDGFKSKICLTISKFYRSLIWTLIFPPLGGNRKLPIISPR